MRKQLISRTNHLDKMEISIFDREMKLQVQFRDLEKREANIEVQTENLELTGGTLKTGRKSIGMFERMLKSKGVSTQTDVGFKDILDREAKLDKMQNLLELNKFKTQEHFDNLER